MSPAPATSNNRQIHPDVQNALTDWLAECDLNWQLGQVEALFRTLPSELQQCRQLALGELVKIDLERSWRENIEVTIESYLQIFPQLSQDETIVTDLLLTEWETRQRHGQRPHFGDFSRRFPQHSDTLGCQLQSATLDQKELVAADSSPAPFADAMTPTPGGQDTSNIRHRDEESIMRTTEVQTLRQPDVSIDKGIDDLPESFGRYRIVGKLGHGGMGDVYLADDTQLNRRVALKVPHFDRRTRVEVLERFDREAKAAAHLDHANICRVFDVGEVDGRRFMVMEFIDGQPLSTLIEAGRQAKERGLDAPKQLTDKAAVQLVQQVAIAAGAAHAKGIIHRDLKPANIMLTADGQPKVTDFGLARFIGAEDHKLTQSGMILGTPAYMPPEQLKGELDKIGPQSDVYSLGVILFELLTGHLPHDFPRNTPISVLYARVLTEPPLSAMTFRPDLDPRLDAILSRATAKTHTDRFASMTEFSAALQAVLDEPTVNAVTVARNERNGNQVARPESSKGVENVRAPQGHSLRNVSGRATFVAITFAAALLLGAILWFRSGDAVVKVEVLADDVEVSFTNESIKVIDGKTEYRVKPGPHRLHIKTGNVEFDSETFTLKRGGNPVVKIERRKDRLESTFGQEAISSTPLSTKPTTETKSGLADVNRETPIVGKTDEALPQPSPALQALRRDQISIEALTLAGNGDPKKAPANLVGVLGEVRPLHRQWISSLVFSPDNRWLASGCFDTTIMLRDPMSAEVKRVLRGHTDRVTSVAFSKDSQSLLSGSEDGTLKIWSVEKDAEPESLSPDIGQILTVAASKDGRFLAAGGKGGVIKLWKWGEWKEPMSLPAIKGTVRVLAFSPDGETLASGWGDEGPDARIRLHRTSDGELIRDWVADKSHVTNLAFHPDGKWLGTTGAGAAVKLWEAATGKLMAEAANWTTWPAMAFHPNGKSMYACLHHNIGHLLELPAMKAINGAERPIHAGAWGIVTAAFRPDGKAFVVGTDTGGVHLWETENWQRQLPTNGHSHYITTLAVHPNGRTVLTGGDDFVVRKWDVTRPTQSQLVQRIDRKLLDLAYSPDGSKYVSTSAFEWHDREQRGFVWDAESGQQLFKLKPPPAIDDVVFSPDGKVMAAGDHSTHCVHLWNAKDGSPLHQFPKDGPCWAQISFTRDGQRLAMATADTGLVKVLDVVSGDELYSFKDEPSGAVALSADGRYLANGHLNGSLSIRDLSAKEPKLRTLTGHTAFVTGMRFTPDNKKLITSSEDGTLRIWSIESPRAQQQTITLGPEKQRVIFDLDSSGQYVFVSGDSPVIFVLRLAEPPAEVAIDKREVVSNTALQALRRDQISIEALAVAGNGDPKKAPANLVAVLGEPKPVHSDYISNVAFSSDGKWLASAGFYDRQIVLRDTATGIVRRNFKGHSQSVTGAVFSKDSLTLVSSSFDGTLKLWSVNDDAEPQTVSAQMGRICRLAASPDGRFVAAIGQNFRVHVWKWGQWDNPLVIVPDVQPELLKADPYAFLALSPDGELLALAHAEDRADHHSIHLYQTADGKKVRTLTDDGNKRRDPSSVTFSADGKYLACQIQGIKVGVWEVASGKSVAEFTANHQWGSVNFSPDGKKLVIGARYRVEVHDLATKTVDRVLHAGHTVCDVGAFSPDGKLFAGGFRAGMLHVWDTTTWNEKYTEAGHGQYVRSLAISPDGGKVLSAGNDDTLRQWDLTRPGENKIVHRFIGDDLEPEREPPGPFPIAYCPDGKQLALLVRGIGYYSFHDERAVTAWDAVTLNRQWSVKLNEMWDNIVFSPNGKLIAGSHSDGTVRLLNADNGVEVHRFPAIGRCAGMAFSSNSQLLVAATWDKNSIKVWDVESGAERHSWQDQPMSAATFEPHDKLLVIGHMNGSVSIWDLTEGKKLRTLTGHTAPIKSLKFTPDGKTLISSGRDGVIRVWSPDRERAREVIPLGPPNSPLMVDLDASGRFLVAAGNTPVIFVLRLDGTAADSGDRLKAD